MTNGSKLPRGYMGRPLGSPNKVTRLVREAILMAAEMEGSDGKGEGGLVGYLREIARTEKKAMATLIGRVLPLQIAGSPDAPVQVLHLDPAQLEDLSQPELRLLERVFTQKKQQPKVIDADPTEYAEMVNVTPKKEPVL